MYPEYPNLYQRARKATYFSQEEAAELIGLSAESMKQYESGRRVPSDDTVHRMAELYNLPWLELEHAKATDRLGVLPTYISSRYRQPASPSLIASGGHPTRSTRCLRLPRMASSTNASAPSLTPLSPICARPSPRPIKSSTLTAQKKNAPTVARRSVHVLRGSSLKTIAKTV